MDENAEDLAEFAGFAESWEYKVFDYDFAILLENGFADNELGRSVASLLGNPNVEYFYEYFKRLVIKTLVIETEYVDGEYLADFAAYHARCHDEISTRTRRLHFFRNAFTHIEFQNVIRGKDENLRKALQAEENYAGFIVVKPLPKTFLGRTCLKTYPADGWRSYPITRSYSANLFGIALTVKSVAFQPQDGEVSACATSALWSLFHATQARFGNTTPSPHEITKLGSQTIPDSIFADSRRFPAIGLTQTQVAYAMREVGLESCMIGTKNIKVKDTNFGFRRHSMNAVIHAHLAAGIPVFLGCDLYKLRDDEVDQRSEDSERKPIAFQNAIFDYEASHAMTILGYRMAQQPTFVPEHVKLPRLYSARIEQFYAHDDRLGPFARMRWDETNTYLTDSWRIDSEDLMAPDDGKHFFLVEPQCLIIPLSEEIRLPYEKIEEAIAAIDQILQPYLAQHWTGLITAEWEITLTSLNEFRNHVLSDGGISGEEKEHLLTMPLPKFLWCATLLIRHKSDDLGTRQGLEIIIDSTALSQQGGFREIIARDEKLFKLAQKALATKKSDKELQKSVIAMQIQAYLELAEMVSPLDIPHNATD
jgi:hypothetical protein